MVTRVGDLATVAEAVRREPVGRSNGTGRDFGSVLDELREEIRRSDAAFGEQGGSGERARSGPASVSSAGSTPVVAPNFGDGPSIARIEVGPLEAPTRQPVGQKYPDFSDPPVRRAVGPEPEVSGPVPQPRTRPQDGAVLLTSDGGYRNAADYIRDQGWEKHPDALVPDPNDASRFLDPVTGRSGSFPTGYIPGEPIDGDVAGRGGPVPRGRDGDGGDGRGVDDGAIMLTASGGYRNATDYVRARPWESNPDALVPLDDDPNRFVDPTNGAIGTFPTGYIPGEVIHTSDNPPERGERTDAISQEMARLGYDPHRERDRWIFEASIFPERREWVNKIFRENGMDPVGDADREILSAEFRSMVEAREGSRKV